MKTICKQGFSLLEMLVVVLIIGILVAIAVPQYQKAVFKARATEAITMLRSLNNAWKICKLERGEAICANDPFDNLVIGVPAISQDCIEGDECFRTKNWEISTEYSGFWAFPIEGGQVNNNFQMGISFGEQNFICEDDRGGNENLKSYEGYCALLNL